MISHHLKALPGLCALLLLAASLHLFARPAFALEELQVEGTAFLDEEACAKGLQSPGCILTFQISGKAAKQLYEGMSEKAIHEECTGGMQKFNKAGLNCIKAEDGTYSCDFGYDFSKKKFSGGAMDC